MRSPVQSDLRITRVVLYQSGVGYFERRGRVHGDVLSLQIRHDQVMDVLKSLTVVDTRSGGTVTVSLPAERSRLMEAAQLPPQVRQGGGLLAIAAAFRGATAILRTDTGTLQGRLIGVENLGTDEKPDWRVSLLSGETLSSHPVTKIKSMQVLDRTLTVGLSKSLDAALNKGSWKPVSLTVRLDGKGPHDLVVSYVVPMPTWKPAYRLVVGDAKDDGGDQKVLLQGWSVVDNLSGEDWRKAHLSLTAGTPLAFRYDLYTPRDVQRPDLTPQGVTRAEAPPPAMDATGAPGARPKRAASPPPAAAESRQSYMDRRAGAGGGRGPRGGSSSSSPMSRSLAMDEAEDMDRSELHEPPAEKALEAKALEDSYRAMVSGRSVGSLFRYDIERPVTVPDRSSALVSIVSKQVAGADVLYFLVGSGKSNPYRAVRFKNTTGFVLERGPVTIYRSGAFVGEALGGRIEKDAVSFVPYALEGRVIMHLSSSSKDEGLKLLTIRDGVITVETQSVTHFTYKITDRTGEPLTLYVARPRRDGWKVIEPKEIILEKDMYYTRIPLSTSGETEFTVKEATPVRRRLTAYDSRARQALAFYLQGSSVPAELREKLTQVLALQEEISSLDTKMSTLQSSISMLRRRQADLRENLHALGDRGNQDLRRQLTKSMAELETQLNALNRDWVQHNIKRGELRQRLQVLFKMVKL